VTAFARKETLVQFVVPTAAFRHAHAEALGLSEPHDPTVYLPITLLQPNYYHRSILQDNSISNY
jgi:hypothetical protein